MSELVYEAAGLAKSYSVAGRSLEVLRGVDLTIARGEVLAIVGSSGAGKSTLLHLLGLLDRPTSGTLSFLGRPVAGLRRGERAELRRAHIGFVFQFYHLIHELTALENVMLTGMMQGGALAYWKRRRQERERAAAELERLGLKDRLDHRPTQLSGGERQRVAIARALVRDPEVVLCDEPTGNLDERTAREIADLLFELSASTSKTFVLVTHDQRLAARAGRTLTLHYGQVAPDGGAATSER